MREVIPQHADEFVRNCLAQTTVARKPLEDLDSMFQHQVLVVHWCTGGDGRNGLRPVVSIWFGSVRSSQETRAVSNPEVEWRLFG